MANTLEAPLPLWTVDTATSSVDFVARHLVVHPVRGKFTRWNATLRLDERDLAASAVRATIEIASIDTGNAERDAHLQSLFDATRFPTATFDSTRITRSKRGLEVAGDFTMKWVTREITLDASFSRTHDRISFVAKTAVGRRNHGLVWSPAIELSSGVSDRVGIELRLDAVRS